MAQNPGKANSFSAIQEISHILLNLKAHYRVHIGLALVPAVAQQCHHSLCHSSKIHCNGILQSMPRNSK